MEREAQMKISDLIDALDYIRQSQGDIEIQLQSNPNDPQDLIINSEQIFIVPEEYDEGWIVNIRSWPY